MAGRADRLQLTCHLLSNYSGFLEGYTEEDLEATSGPSERQPGSNRDALPPEDGS